jgi:hypothetical protein
MVDAQSIGLVTPAELHKLTEDAQMAKIREALAEKRKAEAEQQKFRSEFLARELRPDTLARLMGTIRRAAERGETEVLLGRFPASFCTDGGRAINNFEKEWHRSLDGIARRGYEFYAEHLRPLGFRMRAQILSYPDGKLGDVGLFLSW